MLQQKKALSRGPGGYWKPLTKRLLFYNLNRKITKNSQIPLKQHVKHLQIDLLKLYLHSDGEATQRRPKDSLFEGLFCI